MEVRHRRLYIGLNKIHSVLVFISILAGMFLLSSIIQPYLHYHLQQIAFIKGSDFFTKFIVYPGGLSDYSAIFISQFFCFNIFGSFLILVMLTLQSWLAVDIIRNITGKSQFTFLVFILLLFSGISSFYNYHYPFYITVRLFISIVFIRLFLALSAWFREHIIWIWISLAAILFYIAGGPAQIIFSFIVGISILQEKRTGSIAIATAIWIFAVFLPFLGYKYCFPLGLDNFYHIYSYQPPAFLSYITEIPVYISYGLLPVILFINLIASLIHKKNKAPVISSKKLVKELTQKNRPGFQKRNTVILGLQVITCLLMVWILFDKYFDPFNKKVRLTEYYAEQEKWPEILRITTNPGKDETVKDDYFRINFQRLRALAHSGQLAEGLFTYPQILGTYGLIIDASHENSAAINISDLYYDLGLVSESQRWAFEAQTLQPNSPRILKRLVLISLIRGKYQVAGEFLSMLNHNPLYTDWVKKYQAYVNDTSLCYRDNLIMEKRTSEPSGNNMFISADESLRQLIKTNHKNHLAVEYLGCWYLLDTNPNEFIDFLKSYEEYGLNKLPRSWAEALCYFSVEKKGFPSGLPAKLEREALIYLNNLIAFNQLRSKYRNDQEKEEASVYDKFGRTYWFYHEYTNPASGHLMEPQFEIK